MYLCTSVAELVAAVVMLQAGSHQSNVLTRDRHTKVPQTGQLEIHT